MNVANVAIAGMYVALTLVIVATNRDELRAFYDETMTAWRDRHPRGRLWDDVRSAANAV